MCSVHGGNIKSLVTGLGGFVGAYLAEALDGEVQGYDLSSGGNILDYEQLRNAIDTYRPDYIYHLAAQAFVPESFTNPRRALEVNTIGSLNLLEAVRQLGIKTKILLAGTSEEYGGAKTNLETSLPEPASPYAISKLAMDYLGRWYASTYGMNVVVTRAFNHTGPGRGEMYAESAFAKQIAEIEVGRRESLRHGNLDSVRNFTDVRDMVEAYKLAIDLPSDVYNICSDQNVKMQVVLDTLKESSKVGFPSIQEPSLVRPSDFSFAKPSCKKFKELTSWKPKIKLETTLSDILNYWRERT